MIEAALYDLLNECIKIEKLQSGADVSAYFDRTATYDNRFTRQTGCFSFGSGPNNCLLFSYGTGGETLGGTGLVALTNLLQRGTCNFRKMPVTWHFAPELDLSTPAGIETLRTAIRESQPAFIFAMAGNLSTDVQQPARFVVKSALPEKHCHMIRSMFKKSGIELGKAGSDRKMGEGFYLTENQHDAVFSEIPADCQFLQPVFANSNDLLPADQVFLQTGCGLTGIDSLF